MKRLSIALAALLPACDQSTDRAKGAPPAIEAAVQAPATKPAAMVARPEDQAQLDRMILAGYTPHADHLHAPGVNECPMSTGTEAVM